MALKKHPQPIAGLDDRGCMFTRDQLLTAFWIVALQAQGQVEPFTRLEAIDVKHLLRMYPPKARA